MRFMRAFWCHEFDDEPVLILCEVGEDGFETRKVEAFRDGRMIFACEGVETDEIGLSYVPIPPNDEINADPQFHAEAITPAEFEAVWQRAVTQAYGRDRPD